MVSSFFLPMRTLSGHSFLELLITLALIAMILTCMSATWLYALHTHASINQMRLAEQLLDNIAQELALTQNTWDGAALNDWRSVITQFFPEASLTLTTNNIQLSWPSNQPMNIHCSSAPNQACVAFTLSSGN